MLRTEGGLPDMSTLFAEARIKLRKVSGHSQVQLGNKMFVNSSTVT